jgi:hypothetical protein
MGRVLKTYQGFGGLNDIERIMGQTEKNPILMRNADGTKIWQGTFFHSGYYYHDATKPERVNRVKSPTPPLTYWSDAAKILSGGKHDGEKGSTKPTSTLGIAESNQTSANGYTAKYTFRHGRFVGKYLNKAENKYEGYEVTFRSYHNCKEGDSAPQKPYEVKFDVKCKADDTKKDGPINWTPTESEDKCTLTFKTESIHGCETLNLGFLEVVRKFMGVVEILFGIFLCFAGARFYELVVQLLSGVAGFVFILGLGNTFFVLGGASKVPLIATIVVGIIAGAAAGYFSKQLMVKKWDTILIMVLVGASLGFMLTSAFNLAAWLKYLIIAAIAAVAGYFGHKLGELIKVLGTAVIGSALLTHGAGAYIGGFPTMGERALIEMKSNWGYIGYLVAWIVLAVGGFFVQKKFFSEEKSKDAMHTDEEGGSKDKYYGQ